MAEESSPVVVDAPDPVVPDVSSNGTVAPDAPSTPVMPPVAEPPAPAREPARTAPAKPDTPSADPVRQPPPEPPKEDVGLNWRNLAEREYRDDPVLKKYETVSQALKALVHQERRLGGMIAVPKDGASETQWRALYQKLGCPEHLGDYVVTDPDMGEHEDGSAKRLDPDFLSGLLSVAHEAGLNSQQAQKFVDFAGRLVVRSDQIQAGAAAVQKAEAERELYAAFGGETATMLQKAKLAIANLGNGRYGGGAYAQRMLEKWEASPLSRDADTIATFANMWDTMGEGHFVDSGSPLGMTSRETLEADSQALTAVILDERRPIQERHAAQQKQLQIFRQLNELREAEARRPGWVTR